MFILNSFISNLYHQHDCPGLIVSGEISPAYQMVQFHRAAVSPLKDLPTLTGLAKIKKHSSETQLILNVCRHETQLTP
jgi:hypothetical protein